ncbi:hypothetical protein KIPB_000009 [Kipferlia bialata]|uniref:Uncharacterized protein n=1 Tax=Kipferlia bialata TaxID=797122 RepID=A0A9K3CMQ8_9EUKA|nr:hypothetical protein KIPB_000009 [Kipferlia bialata]|eukprot:g9.t1
MAPRNDPVADEAMREIREFEASAFSAVVRAFRANSHQMLAKMEKLPEIARLLSIPEDRFADEIAAAFGNQRLHELGRMSLLYHNDAEFPAVGYIQKVEPEHTPGVGGDRLRSVRKKPRSVKMTPQPPMIPKTVLPDVLMESVYSKRSDQKNYQKTLHRLMALADDPSAMRLAELENLAGMVQTHMMEIGEIYEELNK